MINIDGTNYYTKSDLDQKFDGLSKLVAKVPHVDIYGVPHYNSEYIKAALGWVISNKKETVNTLSEKWDRPTEVVKLSVIENLKEGEVFAAEYLQRAGVSRRALQRWKSKGLITRKVDGKLVACKADLDVKLAKVQTKRSSKKPKPNNIAEDSFNLVEAIKKYNITLGATLSQKVTAELFNIKTKSVLNLARAGDLDCVLKPGTKQVYDVKMTQKSIKALHIRSIQAEQGRRNMEGAPIHSFANKVV